MHGSAKVVAQADTSMDGPCLLIKLHRSLHRLEAEVLRSAPAVWLASALAQLHINVPLLQQELRHSIANFHNVDRAACMVHTCSSQVAEALCSHGFPLHPCLYGCSSIDSIACHAGRIFAWQIPTSQDVDIPPPVSLPCNFSRSLFTISIGSCGGASPYPLAGGPASQPENGSSSAADTHTDTDQLQLMLACTSLERCVHLLSVPVQPDGPAWKLARVQPLCWLCLLHGCSFCRHVLCPPADSQVIVHRGDILPRVQMCQA